MKKFLIVFVFMMLAGVCLAGCRKEEEKQLSVYDMNLSYDAETNSLNGQEKVTYINHSDNAFSDISFHLYPNAFRKDAKFKPYTLVDKDSVFNGEESYGNIDIKSVKVGGQDSEHQICGEDENILSVKLKETLYPDEMVEIEIEFVTTLPEANHRLGRGENAVNFGNFYPIACVYENGKGFNESVYSSNGDPFYSDCANYNVQIEYPTRFKLASSGKQNKTSQNDGLYQTNITGNKIRDFCFVLSEKFEHIADKVDGVEINYYYYDDANPEESLKVACEAVETFGDMFGAYPYSQLSIVETNFLNGGMEYPNLVMIADDVKQDYNYVIVHEIAHQWWYGVVGNDQNAHAWQDEGLAEYSTLLFYEKHSSYNLKYDEMIKAANSSYKHFLQIYSSVNGKVDTSMDRLLTEFDTEPEYVNCTYTKGVLMFDALRESVGQRKLLKALKAYYKNYSFLNPSKAEMIACFERATGVKLESFFDSWLSGEVVVL